MSENEEALPTGASEATKEAPAAEAPNEDISYHAVEKDGVVTAIWEMQGRKHVKTIDPRSRHGQDILRLYTTEHHDEPAPARPAKPLRPELRSGTFLKSPDDSVRGVSPADFV